MDIFFLKEKNVLSWLYRLQIREDRSLSVTEMVVRITEVSCKPYFNTSYIWIK